MTDLRLFNFITILGLTAHNWVQVTNTQIEIHEKTRDLLNTEVGLINRRSLSV